MRRIPAVLLFTLVGTVCGCSHVTRATEVAAPHPTSVALPDVRTRGPVSLEQTLAHRRSVRRFTNEPLTLQEISQLLWAAQGITAGWGGRTAPSAGALYPLELYVASPDGFYHYVPSDHTMELVSRDDLRPVIWEASLRQAPIRDAPVVFVITAVYERTAAKYGDRAERYALLEAGHAAQNLLLQAVALDLGAVVIGAFYDDQLSKGLLLPAGEAPIYVIPTGHPGDG